MDISYKKYQRKDKKIIEEYLVELCKCVASFNPLRRKCPKSDFSETYLNSILPYVRKGQGVIYVAIHNNVIVGFCSGYVIKQSKEELREFLPKKIGIISDLFVNYNYQNKGVGSSLMKQTENYLVKVGCRVINVEVMDQNVKARLFYKKLGYIDGKIEIRKYI